MGMEHRQAFKDNILRIKKRPKIRRNIKIASNQKDTIQVLDEASRLLIRYLRVRNT